MHLIRKHLLSCPCELTFEFTAEPLPVWFSLLGVRPHSQLPKMPILKPMNRTIGDPNRAVCRNSQSLTNSVSKFLVSEWVQLKFKNKRVAALTPNVIDVAFRSHSHNE